MTDVHTPREQAAAAGEETVSFGITETEPDATGSGAGTGPSAGWLRWGWRQLTSMRTALVLLFLLALGSVPGSVLPQQGSDPAAVQQYYASHPALAPWLNHLGLFNVFAAPWFAAVYLLLFTSLVGCVVPRTFKLAGSARTPPPRAPRNLRRLPHSASFPSSLAPGAAVDAAAAMLGGQRFRLRRPASGDSGHWVSAEKGYLREAGNLLFHLALLGVLVSIALGGLFGYKADKLLVEGQAFSDTMPALDEFHPGRLVSESDLAPFSLTLDRFSASYLTSGDSRGQPSDFNATVTYSPSPGAPSRTYNIRINDPLSVDSTKVYLIGHGYAPVFKVTDSHGNVAYNEATPFIPANTGTFLSDGVVKAPDASLGFMGVFVPTAVSVGGTLESAFPADRLSRRVADRLLGQPRHELRGPAVGLPAEHGGDDEDLRVAAPDAARADVDAARRARGDHVRRRQAVGVAGDHVRPGAGTRARVRDARARRAAAVVPRAAAAGVRAGGACRFRQRLRGDGRRAGAHRRQRRLRGGVRRAGRGTRRPAET